LDKPRVLVLNFRALALAETIGKFNIFRLKVSDIGMNEFRALGYAGLLKYDPKLTIEQYDDLIDSEDRLNAIMKAVLKAMDISFASSKQAGEEENPQTPASPVLGQTS